MLDYRHIWQSYIAFHSSQTTQQLLMKCYQRENVSDPEKKSYDNCYPFIYYLEHGQNYYQLASKAPLSIKPVLLFYGMVQLLKACLLTVDSQYPDSTSVLAHGVSTRKRKKQSYAFLQDEVKVQKNGLFSHFSEKMFHVKHLDGEKFTMEDLLKRIPELNDLFSIQHSPSFSCIHQESLNIFDIPSSLLDQYHMTARRFTDFLIESTPYQIQFEYSEKHLKDKIQMIIPSSHKPTFPLTCSPFFYHLYDKNIYLPSERDQVKQFPEVMVHYLLLYNLSMISRYETEWWSDLLHSYSSNDYPYIHHFLNITAEKIPYLLFLFLYEQVENGHMNTRI
ncbi:YaaC family protein [Bacillus timonensis]|nr:YaaC family protein [Bacillus timonensis]